MMPEIYQEISRIVAEGEEAAIATIVSVHGSTPREVGAKMLVRSDGSIVGTIGGGKLEALVIEQAVKTIRQGQAQQLHFDLTAEGEPGMICGGDTEIFIEPILTTPTLYIFGGGHISLALSKMGKMLGFRTAVFDDREEYANKERFPEADLIFAEDFASAFDKVKKNINKASYIIIVTRGHKFDEDVLRMALGTKPKYIGMIGSRTKNQVVYSHLLAKGFEQEQINQVHAPIGLAIYAQTPEEIAISILAEVIKVRRAPV